MKMVLAIVSHDDAHNVISNLTQNGFQATRLATTGGFLMMKNTTVLVGVDEDKVNEVINIIKEFSKRRSQYVPAPPDAANGGIVPVLPTKTFVGGATVFVLDVERFEKL